MARVVVAEPIAEAGVAVLQDAGHRVDLQVGRDRSELLASLQHADALLVRSQTRVDAELLASAPNLVVVGRAGTGLDNVDLDQVTRLGVAVVNAPEASAISVAEHTFALLLALARRVAEAHAAVVQGGWERQRFTGMELAGKTLGIVGLGRIGSLVAERARAFGMVVLAHDPGVDQHRGTALGVRLVPLEALVAQADVLSIHVPLTPATRGMVGRALLAQVKPGVLLVNTARGEVVDEAALLEGLASGRVAGAALDVFAVEPPRGSPLLEHPRVLATPHLGAQTHEAQVRAGVLVAERVLGVLTGSEVPLAGGSLTRALHRPPTT